jgi:hypothetical protein
MFEAACAGKEICFRRIRTSKAPRQRRPDYRVDIPRCSAIIEVKQIDPNSKDIWHTKELAAGRSIVFSNTPGARLRPAIRDARGQLQRISRLGIPTAVAIFDATRSLSYTDPYHVKTVMYGLDAVILALPSDPTKRARGIGMKRAGKATLTAQHNTSISAVIIIRAVPSNEGKFPLLLVYHNHFARVPIESDHLSGYIDYQFALGATANGATSWIELDAPPVGQLPLDKSP